jgi:hypothetical protein
MQRLFNILFEFQPGDSDRNPIVYQLDEAASLLFVSWVNHLEIIKHEENDYHLKSALSKQKELALRLLVIFHTVHCVRYSLSPNKPVDSCMMGKAIIWPIMIRFFQQQKNPGTKRFSMRTRKPRNLSASD